MTTEEKGLLLKDLCARLPYGVKGIITFNGDKNIFTIKGISDTECCNLEDFKLYLRSMSSMTEKEEMEYDATFATIKFDGHYDSTMTYKSFDWLNAHHFDYRGLIEKGLALEAPEEMYF